MEADARDFAAIGAQMRKLAIRETGQEERKSGVERQHRAGRGTENEDDFAVRAQRTCQTRKRKAHSASEEFSPEGGSKNRARKVITEERFASAPGGDSKHFYALCMKALQAGTNRKFPTSLIR